MLSRRAPFLQTHSPLKSSAKVSVVPVKKIITDGDPTPFVHARADGENSQRSSVFGYRHQESARAHPAERVRIYLHRLGRHWNLRHWNLRHGNLRFVDGFKTRNKRG